MGCNSHNQRQLTNSFTLAQKVLDVLRVCWYDAPSRHQIAMAVGFFLVYQPPSTLPSASDEKTKKRGLTERQGA
jgi:hypothetical protein